MWRSPAAQPLISCASRHSPPVLQGLRVPLQPRRSCRRTSPPQLCRLPVSSCWLARAPPLRSRSALLALPAGHVCHGMCTNLKPTPCDIQLCNLSLLHSPARPRGVGRTACVPSQVPLPVSLLPGRQRCRCMPAQPRPLQTAVDALAHRPFSSAFPSLIPFRRCHVILLPRSALPASTPDALCTSAGNCFPPAPAVLRIRLQAPDVRLPPAPNTHPCPP